MKDSREINASSGTRYGPSAQKCALFLLLGMLLVAGGGFILYYAHNLTAPCPRNVTIWIHGTRGSEIAPVSLSQRAAKVEHELCFCPPGLHHCQELESKYHMRTIGQILGESCPNTFPVQSFYVFGWSGALSFSERKQAATCLYQEARLLSERYKQADGIAPLITIITHSHGGNVALNMGAVQAVDDPRSDFQIDRLILLACPVQKETASLTSAPLFKRVYSLHSHIDALQVLDPQGFHAFVECSSEAWSKKSFEPLWDLFFGQRNRPVFSERHFEPNDKLVQVRVRWQETHPWNDEDIAIFSEFRTIVEGVMTPYLASQRDLLHIEFMLPSFLKKLPLVLEKIRTNDYATGLPSIDETVDRIVHV